MPTPLAFIKNARILVTRPGSRGGPDTGYAVVPGQEILVRAYVKQVSQGSRADYADKVDLSIATDIFSGYVVDWAEVPNGADWRSWDPSGDSTLDQTGIRPAELGSGQTINFYFSERTAKASEVMENSSSFGDEGIGTILREKIGDRVIIKCEWAG